MEESKSFKLESIPLSEKIAALISSMILKGEFKAGTKLAEVDLSKKLGFSRTPVREALRILEREGFVEITPRKGAIVSKLTDKDIDEIFTLKYKLESLAAILASKNISYKDNEYLNSLNEKILKFSRNKNISTLIDLNSEFHSFLISKCENMRLIKILNSILSQFNRATAISYSDEVRINEIVEEHRKIINALKQRDDNLIEKALEEHVQNGWKYIKKNFDPQGD
jgi:DNA-binding GntR family transcriptional regulator